MQAFGVRRPRSNQVCCHPARAIDQTELTHTIDQRRIGNTGRRRIGRRLKTVEAANRHQPRAFHQAFIHCPGPAQQTADLDIHRIHQRRGWRIENAANHRHTGAMNNHPDRPIQRLTNLRYRVITGYISDAGNQPGMQAGQLTNRRCATRDGYDIQSAGTQTGNNLLAKCAGCSDHHRQFIAHVLHPPHRSISGSGHKPMPRSPLRRE
ncbi:hypothetical protein D3C76_1182150 [compost metagenome]